MNAADYVASVAAMNIDNSIGVLVDFAGAMFMSFVNEAAGIGKCPQPMRWSLKDFAQMRSAVSNERVVFAR